MEYLDPKKEFRHHLLLMVGYLCLAVAITLAALVLLYKAYGFDIGKDGAIIQNGLTFFSSQPHPADIYVNDKLAKVKTNTRLSLPEGIYKIKMARTGYVDWQRTVQLDGGKVEHFDYPFLIPKNLISKKAADLNAAPTLVTQSPDRRWLVILPSDTITNFVVYDLKSTVKITNATVSLPENLLDGTTGTSMQVIDWADDNQHVLLKHLLADNKYEYILMDRNNPSNSVNLTKDNNITAPEITLKDRKFDRYYLYDPANHILQTQTIKETSPTAVLDHVLAYKSYGSNSLLYVTDSGAPSGKVLIKLNVGSTSYNLRTLDAGANYPIDLTEYSGQLYVVITSSSLDKIYIYRDPIGQLNNKPKQALVPAQVLRVPQPTYVNFSASAQYILAESGQHFGVYDIENKTGYTFITKDSLDAPQAHASWMDGNRVTYITGGKQMIFDYDYTNQHILGPDLAQYNAAFTPTFKDVYTVAPAAADPTRVELISTALVTTVDR
jgi:hypothetical protein